MSIMQRIRRELELEMIRAPAVALVQDGNMRCTGIRQFYRLALPQILEAGSNEWGIDPYEVDWISIFTPIELALWHDIRAADLVMYPQFPIGGYFVDFANPAAKVCIECDGREFHKDKAKDQRRDEGLQALGWTVYRITGSECRQDFNEETMTSGAARRLVDMIARNHRVQQGRSYV